MKKKRELYEKKHHYNESQKNPYQRAIENAMADQAIRNSVKNATGYYPAGRVGIYRDARNGEITERTLAISKAEAITQAGGAPSDEIMHKAGFTGKHARELLAADENRKRKKAESRMKKKSV